MYHPSIPSGKLTQLQSINRDLHLCFIPGLLAALASIIIFNFQVSMHFISGCHFQKPECLNPSTWVYIYICVCVCVSIIIITIIVTIIIILIIFISILCSYATNKIQFKHIQQKTSQIGSLEKSQMFDPLQLLLLLKMAPRHTYLARWKQLRGSLSFRSAASVLLLSSRSWQRCSDARGQFLTRDLMYVYVFFDICLYVYYMYVYDNVHDYVQLCMFYCMFMGVYACLCVFMYV